MTDLFLDVFNASVAASWVVLAVVLARLLLKKAPRSLVCALWALVALRLLFNGAWEAPFSLLPSDQIIPPDSLFDQAPVINSGISSLDNAVNPIYSETLRANPAASVNPLQVWLAVFTNIWVLGMAIMAAWAGISWLRVRRQVRESIQDGAVYLCDRIDSPFIFGLFRPIIYLPSGLDGAARSHVIAHEQAHLRRRDHWWKPLGFALLAINWFNPAMWLAYLLLCRDIEMACDERVVRAFNPEDKKAYSAALLRCSVNSRRITACPLAFGEVGVKQRVKSVLHYKKPAFWVILAAVSLTVVLAVCMLTSPESPKPEIRWDGILYIQDGRSLEALPADAQNVGSLRSVLHDEIGHPSYQHPNENSQSVNLSWEYAGQPLYLADGMLYIENPGGGTWLPFVQKHSPEDVYDMLRAKVQCNVILEGEPVSVTGFLSEEQELALRELLNPDRLRMQPSMDWSWEMLLNQYTAELCVNIDSLDFSSHCLLLRRETDWLMVYRDGYWSACAWTFESAELDAFFASWQKELAYATELFGPFATDEAPIYLEYHDMTMLNISLRMGVPAYNLGADTTTIRWDWQGSASYEERTVSMMCSPFERATWLRIQYCDTPREYSGLPSHAEPLTLPSGATGTLYHSGNPARWERITLNTAHGQLQAELDTTHGPSLWNEEDYRIALAILGTIRITKDGNSLFDPPSGIEDPNLGISLRAEDATCKGLRLVCTQEGGSEDWVKIETSPAWILERFENGAWSKVMPTALTTTEKTWQIPLEDSIDWNIDFEQATGLLDEGLYRISKIFYAYPQPDDIKSATQVISQTCYAEFTVNPLGIALSVENVTPKGLTLVCSQNGGQWDSIITGSPWSLERWDGDGWVSVMPEETAWTSIGLPVNLNATTRWSINWNLIVGELSPGRYRVGKSFTGTGKLTVIDKCAVGEGQRQTCCAEFTIE